MLTEGTDTKFEVWVENTKDGTHLDELQVTHHRADGNEPPYSECFIETIDEAFAIKVRKVSAQIDPQQCRLDCYVDGTWLSQGVWLSTSAPYTLDKTYIKEKGKTYKTSLKFAPLPTTDEEDKVTMGVQQLKTLGSIELKMLAGRWIYSHISKVGHTKLPTGVAHEKAKKMSYQVQMDDRQEVQNTAASQYRFAAKNPGRYDYRFVFNYRPRALLSTMGLVDDPPVIEPEIVPARPNRKRRHSEAIELADSDDDVKPSIKQERGAKRIKYLEEQVRQLKKSRALDTSKVVIDLTND